VARRVLASWRRSAWYRTGCSSPRRASPRLTLEAETCTPSTRSIAWILRYPHDHLRPAQPLALRSGPRTGVGQRRTGRPERWPARQWYQVEATPIRARTCGPGSRPATRIASRSSKAGRAAPFSPHPQLDVGLTEGLGELVDLGGELLLAPRTRALRVLAPGQRLVRAFEELLLPLRDRRLTHLKPPSSLDLGHLSPEHRQHDRDLLVSGLERLPAQLISPGPTPSHHSFKVSKKS
jgi:hypothetical protein